MTNEERLTYCVWFSGATLFRMGNGPFTLFYNKGGGRNGMGWVCGETGEVLYGDVKAIDGLINDRKLLLEKFLKEKNND